LFRLLTTLLLVALGLLPSAGVVADDGWLVVRDSEYSFHMAFPRDWQASDRRMPQVRMFYNAPVNGPVATCNVIVRPSASLDGLHAKQLDEITSKMSDSDWTPVLGGKGVSLEVLDSRTVELGKRSAKRATIEVSVGGAPVYLRYTTVMLLRPGAIWTFACAGAGRNRDQARQSYAHWQDTFNRIVGSVAFEE
jgi:hypothetical protein